MLSPAAKEVFEKIGPALRPVAERARAAVLQIAPDLREEVKWGNLCFVGQKSFLAIIPHSNHLNLQFFDGVAVDPEGVVLEGTGKAMRHAKLRSFADVERQELRLLIEAAVVLDTERGNA